MEHGPFKLPAISDRIPMGIKPWIFVAFVIVLQTSNVVYLPSMANMAGTQDLHREDVMMCLYAAFAGMNVAFPMMWRFKFCLSTRQILTIVFASLLICNLVTAHVSWFPLLLLVSFIGGFMKMWGTFESISTLNPWIAPGLDFPKFFSLLYIFILCPIYLSGLIDTSLTYFTSMWQSMHWLMIGLFLLLLLFVRLCMVDSFPMGRGPLVDFDLLGLLIWALLMMQMSFIAIYGEHYNWWHSSEIRMATGTALLTAAACLVRTRYFHHPYIKWDALAYRRVPVALILFFILDAIMETPNSLQNILTGQLLHFDAMNTVSFNHCSIIGTLAGCLFSLLYLWRWRLPSLRLAYIGLFMALVYQVCMYFLTSPSTPISHFYLPIILRTFGYACVYTSLTLYLKEQVPFDHFLQVLALVGVVRSGIGGTVGDAIYGYGLRWSMAKNTQLLSGRLADTPHMTVPASMPSCSDLMDRVAEMSIKELWGWTIICCIIAYLLILLAECTTTILTLRKKAIQH